MKPYPAPQDILQSYWAIRTHFRKAFTAGIDTSWQLRKRLSRNFPLSTDVAGITATRESPLIIITLTLLHPGIFLRLKLTLVKLWKTISEKLDRKALLNRKISVFVHSCLSIFVDFIFQIVTIIKTRNFG